MLSSIFSNTLCVGLVAIIGVDALVAPTEIYNGGYSSASNDTALRIATGGAGQSGLVKGNFPQKTNNVSTDRDWQCWPTPSSKTASRTAPNPSPSAGSVTPSPTTPILNPN